MPADVLAQQAGLPGAFMQFIAIAEVLGALGLVLPGLLRIRRDLTPLAAAGLVIIMIGATVVTAVNIGTAPALYPLIVGTLAACVVRGRWQWAPYRRSSLRPALSH